MQNNITNILFVDRFIKLLLSLLTLRNIQKGCSELEFCAASLSLRSVPVIFKTTLYPKKSRIDI